VRLSRVGLLLKIPYLFMVNWYSHCIPLYFIFTMTLILLYIMFLVVMLLVYSKYAFDIVMISFEFIHRITESLIQHAIGLSSRIVCKHGAYILFCLWMHPACRNVW
jgi:hypothetical protein